MKTDLQQIHDEIVPILRAWAEFEPVDVTISDDSVTLRFGNSSATGHFIEALVSYFHANSVRWMIGSYPSLYIEIW